MVNRSTCENATLAFGPATPDELEQVVRLHAQCLPRSVLTLLGLNFLREFYRFCMASSLETVTVSRQDGQVLAGAMVSAEPGSLNTRLLFKSSLIFAVLSHFHLKSVRRAVFDAGHRLDAKPEMIALFTVEQARGQGIGAQLLAHVLAELRQCGQACCFVRTFADADNPAYRFYVREGFSPSGTLVAHGNTFTLLKKELA